MEQKEQREAVCKSVFKNGASTTTKKQFTRTWIDFINEAEKGKKLTLTGR